MSIALSVAEELSSVCRRLDDGPLNARILRAVEVLRSTSPQERALDGALNILAGAIVSRSATGGEPVQFCEVSSDDQWRAVRELRLRSYPRCLPYIMEELSPDGSDRHDRHSFVYAAFLNGRAVATIRATTYPYETLDHIGEAELAAYLGDGWKSDFIEWGRLLVDHELGKLRLMPALITYAGLRLLTLTSYRHYFGYTKPQVRSLMSRFSLQGDMLRFQIPSRGSHQYLLTKGSLGAAAVREVPKWLRTFSGRLVRPDVALGAGAAS